MRSDDPGRSDGQPEWQGAAEQLQWHGMDYRALLEGVRPLPGGDWRSVVPYDSWSPGLLNNIRQATMSAMAPQGNRTVQRQRTTTWTGPISGCASSSSVDIIGLHGGWTLTMHCERPEDAERMVEASWGLYPGGTWIFLGYAYAGQTEIDRGRAGECEFILAAQFPYAAGADSQPSRGTRKRACLASKVMTNGNGCWSANPA